MRREGRRLVLMVGAALAVVLLVGMVLDSGAAAADTPVEATYAAPGPHPVGRGSVAGEGGAVLYELYLPADLAGLDAPAPVVSWGNGSDATPAQYDRLLRHLASWGFVVVASTTTSAGDGTQILDGARWAAAAAADPASPYHGLLDAAAIGVAGHSQGAGGSLRAATTSEGLVRTAVLLSLPARIWVTPGRHHEFSPARLRVPALFLSGELDVVISNALVNRGFYDEVPGPAGMAMKVGAGHVEPQGDGDGFRGYLTAWLRYQLAADAEAAQAFVGPAPELLSNPRWRHRAVKGLSPVPTPDADGTETGTDAGAVGTAEGGTEAGSDTDEAGTDADGAEDPAPTAGGTLSEGGRRLPSTGPTAGAAAPALAAAALALALAAGHLGRQADVGPRGGAARRP